MATFAAVVHAGSFTAAARALGITKQSVSERISRLEGRLGVQLLVRSTRALRLTDVGEHYHQACAAIVAKAEEADLLANQAQLKPTGTLRLTCPVGLSRPLILPTVAEYRRIHPGVQFEVLIEERVVDLIKEHIDLAIRVGTQSSSPTYVAKPLFETNAVFVASRELLEKYGEPRTAAELRKLPFITRGDQEVWTVLGEEVRFESATRVNTVFGLADAAVAGLGVAVVPALVVRDEIASGKLRALFGHPARTMKFTAVYPARRLTVKVRSFLDLLVRRARDI
jgi:DNA-binding transcriptional LysR family regulator